MSKNNKKRFVPLRFIGGEYVGLRDLVQINGNNSIYVVDMACETGLKLDPYTGKNGRFFMRMDIKKVKVIARCGKWDSKSHKPLKRKPA